jgi:hypothetical protein
VTKSTKETLFTVGYLVLGVAAAIGIGYLTYKNRFFHFPRPMLPFLVASIAGALIYASVQMKGIGVAILMLVLLFLVQLAMSPPIRASSMVGAAIFSVPVGLSLIASSYAFKALARIKFGKFLLMALIVGFGYAVMIALFVLRSHAELSLGILLSQGFLGAKLGAGLGVAFELVDLTGPRPNNEYSFGKSID